MLFSKNISIQKPSGLLAKSEEILAMDKFQKQSIAEQEFLRTEHEKYLAEKEKLDAAQRKKEQKNLFSILLLFVSVISLGAIFTLKLMYPGIKNFSASVSDENQNRIFPENYPDEKVLSETRQAIYSAVNSHTPLRAYAIILGTVSAALDMLDYLPPYDPTLRELENYLADAEKLLNSDLSEFGQLVDYARIKKFIQTFKSSGLTESEVETVLACGALYCRINDLDPYLFFAMLAKESSFRRTVVSGAGAVGMGQIMPINYSALGITDANNIQQNLRASALHLKGMLNLWSAYSPQQQLELALASYHSGRANILRSAISKNGVFAFNKLTPRTQRYIRDIFANANELRKPKPE